MPELSSELKQQLEQSLQQLQEHLRQRELLHRQEYERRVWQIRASARITDQLTQQQQQRQLLALRHQYQQEQLLLRRHAEQQRTWIQRRFAEQMRLETQRQAELAERQQKMQRLQAVGAGLVTAGYATAGGLVARGLGGTVEAARLDWELKQLGRTLVGVLRPFIATLTDATRFLREFISSLSPGQKSGVAAGLLGVGGYLLGARLGLGLGGSLALAGAGAGLGLSEGDPGSALMMGLGAYSLYRMVRRPAAAAAGTAAETATATATATRTAATAAGAAAQTARAAQTTAQATSTLARVGSTVGWLGRGLGSLAGKVFLPVTIGLGLWEGATGGYYSQFRKEGAGKFLAGVGALGAGFLDVLTFGWTGYYFRKSRGLDKTAPTMDTGPTISAGGTQELGAAYEAIHASISKIQSPTEKLLKEIRDYMEKQVNLQQKQLEKLEKPMPIKDPAKAP